MGWSCVVFLLTAVCVVLRAQDILIYGPSIIEPLFESLQIAFSLGHSSSIGYESAPSQQLPALLQAGHPIVVSSLNVNFPNSLNFPLFGFPLVVVYNLDNESNKDETDSLVLSQQALIDIFVGKITRWNHENLTSLNTIALPDEPITLVVGSLLSLFTEGLSVLNNNEPVDASYATSDDAIQVARDVCSKVSITPFSLGLSWMADALLSGSRLALLENKEGYLADPSNGVPNALSEYHAAIEATPNDTNVLPYNMPGRLSWPLIGLITMVLPETWTNCSQLNVTQQFLTLLMFQEQTDKLVQVLGWEPASSLQALDSSLGSLSNKFDYKKSLYDISCDALGTEHVHLIGTSSQLWAFVLKMLVAYSSINPFLVLSSSFDITLLLNYMKQAGSAVQDIDLVLTWMPVIQKNPSSLVPVPVFMGGIVPIINLGAPNRTLTLSTSLLAQIFNGVIKRWDDAQIAALNRGVMLPSQNIIVFASPTGQEDGPTVMFNDLLSKSKGVYDAFSWSKVNASVAQEVNIPHAVQFTSFSIGYSFAHTIQSALAVIPNMSSSTSKVLTLTSATLSACWISTSHPDCWPLAVPLVMVLRKNDNDCDHQKLAVDFVNWILLKNVGLDVFLVPNPRIDESIGEAEYCAGRSLLYTRPEPQLLPAGAITLVWVLSFVGMTWSVGQAIALAVARDNSDLKSASVLFSLLAVVGVFMMLITPLLIVHDDVSISDCGAAIWFICLGFSFCYGSLFAKLFRLYKIFTSRSLVVPRLSNKKLFYIVLAFLGVDFLLLLIYNIWTPPAPGVYSSSVKSDLDLATGFRELAWTMCEYQNSIVLELLLTIKIFVALAGAVMAFFIRAVDRRFSATSALGGSFYNMFLTMIIAVILMVFFKSKSDQTLTLFIPVLSGLWIILVTLFALTLDSNVLLACKDFSRPLRRMLQASKEHSKDSKDRSSKGSGKKSSNGSGGSEDHDSDRKRSHTGTVFVVNREMFPSKYSEFDSELLEKILEELNFQRSAVRRAMNNSSATTTNTQAMPAIQLVEFTSDRHRGSTQATDASHRFNSKSKSIICTTTDETAKVSVDNPPAKQDSKIEE